MKIRYGSLCSGIEAATSAWHGMGWEPAFFSEIEAFPCAVLKHHHPDVPNFGDMTKFQEWPNADINVLVGGTPCQSFSVAGLRKGLDDPRGNLMLTFGAIANKYRPEWLVWENVPGVLSSNDGKDFGTFLGMLAELGYGFAYRVLDAQYFGVAQRRRRVFVVANARDWRLAAAVLFESASLRGDPPPSRKAREEVAGGIAPGFDERSGRSGIDSAIPSIVGALTARGPEAMGRPAVDAHHLLPIGFGAQMSHPQVDVELMQARQAKNLMAVAHTLRGSGFDASEDGTGRGTPLVPVCFDWQAALTPAIDTDLASTLIKNQTKAIAFDTTQITSPCADRGMDVVAIRTANTSSNGHGLNEEVAYTLDQAQGQAIAFAQNTRDEVRLQGGDGQIIGALTAEPGMKQTTYIAQPVAIALQTDVTPKASIDLAFTLKLPSKSGGGQPAAVAVDTYNHKISGDCAGSLTTTGGPPLSGPGVLQAMQVRRLTPVECERLQGFPDDYTAIPWRKKPAEECPDGPRYKALGNSMAVPVMRWIGERIQKVNEISKDKAGTTP